MSIRRQIANQPLKQMLGGDDSAREILDYERAQVSEVDLAVLVSEKNELRMTERHRSTFS